jgi:hypothetical protein
MEARLGEIMRIMKAPAKNLWERIEWAYSWGFFQSTATYRAAHFIRDEANKVLHKKNAANDGDMCMLLIAMVLKEIIN